MTALAERDVRLGGTWTKRQAVKNQLIVWAVRGSLAVVDRLPEGALTALCRAAGRAVFALCRPLRERARFADDRCSPGAESSRVARACSVQAGESLATTLLLRRPAVRALARVQVSDGAQALFSAAQADRRGVVFVSAHHGPFELLAAAIAELGHRPAVVVRESYDPRLDPIVDRHRLLRGVEVIHRGAPGAALRIVRALRAGRPVGFLPDLGGRVPGIPARFLGRTVDFPVGPQHIAERAGATLVVGVLSPDPTALGRFSLDVTRIEGEDMALGDLTQRVASTLESAILASGAPELFPWMAVTG